MVAKHSNVLESIDVVIILRSIDPLILVYIDLRNIIITCRCDCQSSIGPPFTCPRVQMLHLSGSLKECRANFHSQVPSTNGKKVQCLHRVYRLPRL